MTSPSRTAKIQKANTKMMTAWQEGRGLLDRLGPRAASGAMIEESGQDLSEAERLRKLRAMASRMTEIEVKEICRRCKHAGRAWGPQFLVALCRLPKRAERGKVVTVALKEGWGLKELKRRIRVALSQSGTPARSKRLSAGRRRKIDWSIPHEIADEVEGMANSWLHLRDEMEAAAFEQDVDDYLELLPDHLRRHFQKLTKVAAKMLHQI